MNPLDMRGPEFLQFYLIYGIAALVGFRILRTLWMHSRLPSTSTRWSPGIYPREGDGYVIAFLRGGKPEVSEALLGRLVATGRLVLDGVRLKRAGSQLEGPRLAPIEQAALEAVTATDDTLAADAGGRIQRALDTSVASMQSDLERNGLLVSDEQKRGLRGFTALALLAVPGLGLAKLVVALERGHTNVGFLIVLILLYAFLVWRVMKLPRQTPAGRKYLAWLRSAHKDLKHRVTDGRRSGEEMALLMGIYGIAALPALPYMHDLRRAMQPPSSNSSSGDGGSSSSSDSGGDGGGDGGGGGGCGGCGGGGGD
jgi:uncharacterized protein (TIGR04222 family)